MHASVCACNIQDCESTAGRMLTEWLDGRVDVPRI